MLEAANGDEATTILQKQDIRVEVLLADIDMRGAMNFGFAKWVRSVRPGLNVGGVDYHQYLGVFNALGQLNAWVIGPNIGRRPGTAPIPCCRAVGRGGPESMAVITRFINSFISIPLKGGQCSKRDMRLMQRHAAT